MIDDYPNNIPDDDTQQHAEANQQMRLDGIELRIAKCESKLQAALAIASHLTPKGSRYEH
jgi:hypothetical protein